MYLKFTKVRDVKSPKRANLGDAGIDFFVPNDQERIDLRPLARTNIPSGIKVEVPFGWALVFFNKSGISSKEGLIVGACVVDHGYTGEVHLNLINTSESTVAISPGMKLVQALLLPVGAFVPMEVEEDQLYKDFPVLGSSRGDGGFGSTGT